MTPYAVHPLRVAFTLVLRAGVDDEATLCAALLHDVIEDTRTDHDEVRERFGDEIADLVSALSKDRRLPERARETAYAAQVMAAGPKAHVAKLADLHDNLGDAIGFPPAERVASAKKKRALVLALCDAVAPELRGFAEEVKARLAAALGARVSPGGARGGARSAPPRARRGPRPRARGASPRGRRRGGRA